MLSRNGGLDAHSAARREHPQVLDGLVNKSLYQKFADSLEDSHKMKKRRWGLNQPLFTLKKILFKKLCRN